MERPSKVNNENSANPNTAKLDQALTSFFNENDAQFGLKNSDKPRFINLMKLFLETEAAASLVGRGSPTPKQRDESQK